MMNNVFDNTSTLSKVKADFHENLKQLDDLNCPDHSKLKTIYVDSLPNEPGKKGFVCDYCTTSSNFKFYSQLLSENSNCIQEMKNVDGDFISLKKNLEKCDEYNFAVFKSSNDIFDLIEKFDQFYLADLYFKACTGCELVKLKDLLDTISFNKDGKPIYESIGKHPERERQYVRLANILVSNPIDDLSSKFYNISFDLKEFLIELLSKRINFAKKSNDFVRFLTGEFLDLIFKMDKQPIDRNFYDDEDLYLYTHEDLNKIRFNYEEELNILKKNNNDLLHNNNELFQNNKFLENDNKQLLAKVIELEKIFSEKLKESQEFKILVDGLRDEKGSLAEKINFYQNQNENLKRDLQISKDEINKTGLERDSLVNKIRDLDSTNFSLKKNLDELKNNYDNDISTHTVSMSRSSNTIGELEKKFNVLISEYEGKLGNFNIQISDLKKNNNYLQEENIRLKTSENKIIYEKNLLNTENKNLKENSDIKIFDLTSKLNEALASRENLLNFHHEEKNNLLLKNKQLENLNQDFEKQLNELKLKTSASQVTESTISFLNTKINELNNINQSLEIRLNNENINNKNLVIEKEGLYDTIKYLKMENQNLLDKIRMLQEQNMDNNENELINASLISDLKNQININQSLNNTIITLQDKVDQYISRLQVSDQIIKNQLEIIKKYTEEKPVINNYDIKPDILYQNRADTQMIKDKLNKLELKNMSRSFCVKISDLSMIDKQDEMKKSIVQNFNKSIYMNTNSMMENNYEIRFPMDSLLNKYNWDLLKMWLTNLNIFGMNFKPILIFKGTRDGFNSYNFQSKCLNIPNTLTIAKTSFDKVIGGFTIMPWKIPSDLYSYVCDYTKNTFLFSLSNGEKYNLRNLEYAICLSKGSGPIFGGGSDFELVSNCNVTYNESYKIGHSYEYSKTPEEFYGSKKYLITDYEVYQII